MSGFFDKIKDAFGSKKPKYKIYEASEVKMVALRTRVILTEIRDQLLKQISSEDQRFRFVGNNPRETYVILQSIGEKVIEAESIKIFVEMMRKVENNAANIAKTNGDISLLKTQIQWFQCVLWYRRSKESTALEDLYSFCMDFFKGVDITKEMDVNCEVFVLYPILKYLKKNEILPLAEVLFYLQPYVSCNIDKPTLDAIFQANHNDIASKAQRSTLIKPSPSKIYPNSAVFAVEEQSPPKQPQNNPYHISQPQQNNPINWNPTYSNMGNIQSTTSLSNSNQPLPNHNNYTGNTINIDYNKPQTQQASSPFEIVGNNGFAPQNSFQPVQQDHNPFSRNSKFQNNSFGQPHSNPNTQLPISQEKKEPQQNIAPHQAPQPTIQVPKKSFFNSLMRTNSNQGRKEPESPHFILGDDREREKNDFTYNQANQSWIPLTQDSYQQFGHNRDLQLKRKAEEERKAQELKRAEEQKRAEELKRQEAERKRLQIEAKQKEQEAKAKAEQQRVLRQKEQAERKAKEEEEDRRDREEEVREREREQRMRDRQREEEREINVFVDNERQEIDRGYSGRFSSNMGFKTNFDDYQGEEFASGAAHQGLNSSFLRFKKEEAPQAPSVSLEQRDQEDSLQAIESGQSVGGNKPFQLFYYKKQGQ